MDIIEIYAAEGYTSDHTSPPPSITILFQTNSNLCVPHNFSDYHLEIRKDHDKISLTKMMPSKIEKKIIQILNKFSHFTDISSQKFIN